MASQLMFLQFTPEEASAWADVPVVGLLLIALAAVVIAFVREWIVPGFRLTAKDKECEAWKTYATETQEKADARIAAADERYANLLLANIEEWRERDRTIETLSRMATRGRDEAG